MTMIKIKQNLLKKFLGIFENRGKKGNHRAIYRGREKRENQIKIMPTYQYMNKEQAMKL